MASQGFDAAAEEATETWYSEVNYIWVAETAVPCVRRSLENKHI